MLSKWTLCFYNPWDFIYWKWNKISQLKKKIHEISEISDIRNLGPVYISCRGAICCCNCFLTFFLLDNQKKTNNMVASHSCRRGFRHNFVKKEMLPVEISVTTCGMNMNDNVWMTMYHDNVQKRRSPVDIACVASVSVGLGSKERPRNGIFGVFPAWRASRQSNTPYKLVSSLPH